jgi:shikimate dehydrogenase
MGKREQKHYRFGLIGKNISYSFSRAYFTKKFERLGLNNHSYENFDLPRIDDIKALIGDHSKLSGLNVTIPYKQAIIPYLDELDPIAAAIGAVNTIKVSEKGLKGYNTDAYGFEKALTPLLQEHHNHALILGTGGASKAIAYVLRNLSISYIYVSRSPVEGQLGYGEINERILLEYPILINCSPVGTFPNTREKPQLPYEFITPASILFDLIYNPPRTSFLLEGEKRGAAVSNGLAMLEHQAEKAWQIWHS